MKKSALILSIFIILGACQDEFDPQISELEETETEIALDIDILTDIETTEFEEEIFLVVEKQAAFNGGTSAWTKHLEDNLIYPEQAKRMGIQGRVFLSFIVDKHGKIADAQIVRGIGAGCDQAALRALLASPDWIPGKQRGREVNSRMSTAITFSLE